ncbi:Polysaccharide deacetylase [Candidatus Rhodobacter oscarellae]|uniref:Chitooligosaccharide deacetylase n=1 Tax=Candidatus Rhodobacter oscarellae TaxID=1675527 RepID=A0A0J9E4G3_9RHOB|nr:polysaccharide deacetylase family protein [Candidatus Rhodobacter lobularis]KMW57670.1 Polysaccharide deacetylase [Candidatus Rhodobacter lobularis]
MSRDLRGYWDAEPAPCWPNGTRLAVSFVVNVEEGAELSIASGDERNEGRYEADDEVKGAPDPCMVSHFGYGPRRGYHRVVEALAAHDARASFSTCGRAAEATPWLIRDAVARGHEVSCHGWRWETHAGMTAEQEREIIARTHAAISRIAGTAPVGWHARSATSPQTRDLLKAHGGFCYDSNAYDDDMPYMDGDFVVLPYAFDTNDMRFSPGGGFVQPRDFSDYVIAGFDRLYAEGAQAARMLSIGLHTRLIGRPARIGALEAILAHITSHQDVWIAPRREIAACWAQHHGARA